MSCADGVFAGEAVNVAGAAGARGGAIRVLVVEDHRMFAEALVTMLSAQPGIDVVGSTGTAAAAVSEARRLRPTVVLMDYRLPDGEGTAAARAIRDDNPHVRVLILTASAEESLVREVMRAGCSGIVTKGRSVQDLVRAVHAAAGGETVLTPAVVERIVAAPAEARPPLLTDREAEVLRLTADGLDTLEIARRLGLSVFTVRNHLQSCIRKLGVHSKTQAVSLAIRRGIIPSPG
jgi:DNA-binding NarL/FixJ family response regulator